MQKLALSAVLFVFSTTLSAQWEKAFPELMPGEVTQIIKRYNGNYAMLVSERKVVYEINDAFNVVAVHDLKEYATLLSNYHNLWESPSERLMLPGAAGACASLPSVFSIGGENDVHRFDFSLSFYHFLSQVVELPSGALIGFGHSGQSIQKVSSENVFFWEKPLSGSENLSLTMLSDTTILIADTARFALTDTAFLSIDTIAFYRGINTTVLSNRNLLSYDKDSIWLSSPELELLSVIPTALGTQIKKVKVGNGQIVILYENDLVNIFDTALQPLNGFFIEEALEISDFAISNGGYLMVGRSAEAPFIKKYLYNGDSEDNSQDISIVSIELTEDLVLGDATLINWWNGHRMYFPIVKIGVHNFGQDTVRSLFLTTEFYPLTIDIQHCYGMRQFFTKRYEQLSIPPGATAELEWDMPDVDYNYLAWVEDPYEICIRSVLPNESLDHNSFNDEHCITTLYVDTPEALLYEPQISVFPNPATGQVQVEWSLPVQKPVVLRLHNAIGQLVYEAPGASKSPALLPTQAAGWYVVSLWQEGQRLAQQKVVWY